MQVVRYCLPKMLAADLVVSRLNPGALNLFSHEQGSIAHTSMVVHLAVIGVVFDGVLFCVIPFSQEMSWIISGTDGVLFCAILLSPELSWMRSGTELSQVWRIDLFHVPHYLSIIGETLQRWGKRILSHCYFLCNR